MKSLITCIACTLASFTASFAQSTLTAASLTPVAGDVFIGKNCDTTGVTKGPAGPSVTWSYPSLTTLFTDTTTYFTCAATPYCSSFPGSNLASWDGSTYNYFIAGPSKFSLNGEYFSGTAVPATDPEDILYFPLTYLSAHKDTFAATATSSGITDYYSGTDSFYCDAWGSLTLPTGVYPHTLRVHKISIAKDSFNILGMPNVSISQFENYSWYDSNYHSPLLSIDYDTAGSTSLYVSNVEYYTFHLPLGLSELGSINLNSHTMSVYPNPATDLINIKYTLADKTPAQITICDMTGRTLKTVNIDPNTTGKSELAIQVSDIPAGMYLVHLQSAGANITRKIVISR